MPKTKLFNIFIRDVILTKLFAKMPVYSIEERLKLYECFIRNGKSRALALREYHTLYPVRRVPSRKIFGRIVRDLENGKVVNTKRNRPKNVLTEQKQLDVLLYFVENEENSERDAERDIPNISKSSIHRTLEVNNYHPYKFLPVQVLSAIDMNDRATFCGVMMDRHFVNQIFKKILWSDEAIFNTAGVFNRKNTHYWSDSNKHKIKMIQKQGYKSVRVWCGIICDRVIGPIFYDGNMNGQRYLNLLNNEIRQHIDDLPENLRQGLIFQQDSAPYHTVAPVVNWLNDRFETWIGRHGTIPWPPRSPDLTPLDFFLWGALKQEAYKSRTNNVEHLKQKIRDEINNINRSGSVRSATNKIEIIYYDMHCDGRRIC